METENVKIKGLVSLKKFSGEGELLYFWEGNNLVVLDGAEYLAKCFMGDFAGKVNQYAIGYNNATPLLTDTKSTLQYLTPTQADINVSGWSRENLTVSYDFVSPSGWHIGMWREAALLVSGTWTLFNRVSLPEMSKQDDEYVICTWKLSF